jgi:hypothetical protein
MTKTLSLVLCLSAALTAQASYLPFLDGIRAAIVDRQVAISNAPPITLAGKKELNVLKSALKAIDKPSNNLAADLKALSSVVLKIDKGASNETFAFEFRNAVSNYFGVLLATNDVLEAALEDANNNPALKAKAADALEVAQMQLAGINAETDVNAAAKNLGNALKRYLSAAKAVTAAVNAELVPLPNPKAGTAIVEVNGTRFVFGAEFPLRNATATGLVGEGVANGSSSGLVIDIPSDGGPGTYMYSWIFNDTVSGTTITFSTGGTDAQVTSASASSLVGTVSGTAQVTIDGGPQQNLPFTARFNGRKFAL